MGRKSSEHPLRRCLQAGRPKLAEVTRQVAPAIWREEIVDAPAMRQESILPRRTDVKIRARHAQLY
jgi:hypothetical protein